jgi:hypothetical protein
MKAIRSYPIIGAVIAQVAAALMVIAVSAALGGTLDPQKLFWLGLAVQSVVAALVTRLLGLPVWWVWIGLCFPAGAGPCAECRGNACLAVRRRVCRALSLLLQHGA